MNELMSAAGWGSSESVQAFVAAGADVNAADKSGWTPLSYALGAGRAECVNALIAAGADA